LVLLALLSLPVFGAGAGDSPLYLIIEIEILDRDVYARYVQQAPEIVRKYGGKYLIRGGRVTPLAGDWNPERIVVIEFAGKADLQRWLNSPEYGEIAPLRKQSTVSRAIIVEKGSLPD